MVFLDTYMHNNSLSMTQWVKADKSSPYLAVSHVHLSIYRLTTVTGTDVVSKIWHDRYEWTDLKKKRVLLCMKCIPAHNSKIFPATENGRQFSLKLYDIFFLCLSVLLSMKSKSNKYVK